MEQQQEQQQTNKKEKKTANNRQTKRKRHRMDVLETGTFKQIALQIEFVCSFACFVENTHITRLIFVFGSVAANIIPSFLFFHF